MRPAPSARRKDRSDGESGAILVELALILPLLMIFFLGIVDGALVIREHQIIQNAAREGARYSILPTSWIDPRNPGMSAGAIQARVIQYLAEEGISVSASDITVTQGRPISVGGITIFASEVTVTYDRSLLLPLGPPLFPGPLTTIRLSGTAVFRNLF